MAQDLPNPPPASSPSDFNSPGWQNWFSRLAAKIRESGQILWTQIDFAGSNLANIATRLFTDLQFTGSNLTSIVTRNHNDLQNIQGGASGDYQHLTTAQVGIVNGVPATYAPLASPALTGTPTAPTAAVGTNTTQLATTAFVLANAASSGPIFSVYQSTAQSLTAATFTKIQFQTKEYDSANAFDNVTNYRFQPIVPGYYFFTGLLNFAASTTTTELALYKNGALFKASTFYANNGSAALGVTVYLNGTTDYVEAWGYSGVTQNSSSGASLTYFQGNFIRP